MIDNRHKMSINHDRKYLLATTRAAYDQAAAACPDLGLTDQLALTIIVAGRKNAVRAIANATSAQVTNAYRRATIIARDRAIKARNNVVRAHGLHRRVLALPRDPTIAQLIQCAPVAVPTHVDLTPYARDIVDHHNRVRLHAGAPGRYAQETCTQLDNYGGYPCYRYNGHIGAVQTAPDRYLLQLTIGGQWQRLITRVSALTGDRYVLLGDKRTIVRAQKSTSTSYAALSRMSRRLNVDLYADYQGVYIKNDITDYHAGHSWLRSLRSLGTWRAQLAAKTDHVLHDLANKKQRDQILRHALAHNIFVTVADSLAAKNCNAGTDSAKKDCERFLHAGDLGGVRADVLIAVRGDQAHSAIIAAALRQPVQMQRELA
jgi:hypothetical protein